MEAIERDNPTLKGVLPGNYGRARLDKRRLGDLVDLVSNKINFADEESRKQDTLGRVYEYFLSQFASQEGRRGGEFYTRVQWCGCWLRCSPPTKAGCSTRAAVRAGCSCRARNLSRRTAGGLATFRFTVKLLLIPF